MVIWKTKDGTELSPKQMGTEHICNAMRILEERGVAMWPFLQEVRSQMDRHSQPGMSHRTRFVLSHCRRIIKWIYIFRRELAERPGVEGMTALEVYDRYYSIVEDYGPLRFPTNQPAECDV